MVERKVQILSRFESQVAYKLEIYAAGTSQLSTLIPGYIWSGKLDSLLLLGNTKVNLLFTLAFQDFELNEFVLRKDIVLPAGKNTVDLIEKAFNGYPLDVGPEVGLLIEMQRPEIFDPARDQITITGSATETGYLQGSARILPVEEGGTGVDDFPPNSLFVSSANGDLIWLPPGTDGQVLKSMGGVWVVSDP